MKRGLPSAEEIKRLQTWFYECNKKYMMSLEEEE